MIIATYWYKSPIPAIRPGLEIATTHIIQQVIIMARFWLLIEISPSFTVKLCG
jgi:hypothetical protein